MESCNDSVVVSGNSYKCCLGTSKHFVHQTIGMPSWFWDNEGNSGRGILVGNTQVAPWLVGGVFGNPVMGSNTFSINTNQDISTHLQVEIPLPQKIERMTQDIESVLKETSKDVESIRRFLYGDEEIAGSNETDGPTKTVTNEGFLTTHEHRLSKILSLATETGTRIRMLKKTLYTELEIR